MPTTVYIADESQTITRLLELLIEGAAYRVVTNAGAADVLVTGTPHALLIERCGGGRAEALPKPFEVDEFLQVLAGVAA